MTSTTVTTLDGSVISASITGITAHSWTADATGLYTTTANLQAEWTSAYATMLAGNGNTLTPLQRLEGNAEAVLENTAEANQTAASQNLFRQDAQREFDAIWAAMQIDQATYGINPNAEFNTYTYLKMQETLRGNETLETLGFEGHGLNDPPASAYGGYTNDIQNKVNNQTFYVGGGPVDNGQSAITEYFDDVVMSHAPFPTVVHNGAPEQLNQNGNIEDPTTAAVTAANSVTFTQVLVASDFSANSSAVGAVVLVPSPIAAPALPTAPAPLQGTTAIDGSILPETISGLTAHTWTADATGTYQTLSDLATEWKSDYAVMLNGGAAALTAIQRLEGNAEAVLENTGAAKLSVSSQATFRADAQKEFDAIGAAMTIDLATYGISLTAPFTAYSYQMLEKTIQQNETLDELGIQGHGLNSPPAVKYDGFTTDFQNRTDGTTYFVGGGPDNGALAISGFFDDDVLTHAPFPAAYNNGTLDQTNQNGNLDIPLLTNAMVAANQIMFNQVLVAGDFNTSPTAVGPVLTVACYAEGTRILTPHGERAIETLRPGDAVLTASGRVRPVRWTGHRRVDLARHRKPHDVMPIRVRAHAFAPGQPSRDLVLSPDHAVFAPGDAGGPGVLIPIRYLLNGASIVQERTRHVTWWHVELDAHDIVLANGLPAESYLDTGNRHAFSNGGPAVMLHPNFARATWDTQGCAELVLEGSRVAATKRRLLAAAGRPLTEDAGLSVLADGQRLPALVTDGIWQVLLPPAARTLRLVSRGWVPAHMRPDEADTRRLGVAISSLTLDGATVPLDDPRLSSGWHDPEPGWRWTDGDAGLALAGARELRFRVAVAGVYWNTPVRRRRVSG